MPQLKAHLVTTALVVALLCAFVRYAEWQEALYVEALAARTFEQKNQSVALQRAAVRKDDLLLLYGACDLPYSTPYHASTVFRNYPTGFTVFPIVRIPPATCLGALEEIAGLGDIRGRKIVILTAPSTYAQGPGTVMEHWLRDRRNRAQLYDNYFYKLPAYELTFNLRLSLSVRQAAARRMLEYPGSLRSDPFLELSLCQLAADSWGHHLLYQLLLPLGKLHICLLELQDHWYTLGYIRDHIVGPPSIARRREAIDWTGYMQEALRIANRNAANNPYGIETRKWMNHFADDFDHMRRAAPDKPSEERFVQDLEDSEELQDLALLLQGLRELGADPLVVSSPIKGPFYDALGIPANIRAVFYRKVAAAARRFSAPCVTFADRDEDVFFLADESGHFSASGWLYFDQALDAFFHAGR